jgi:hypothetical protein
MLMPIEGKKKPASKLQRKPAGSSFVEGGIT